MPAPVQVALTLPWEEFVALVSLLRAAHKFGFGFGEPDPEDNMPQVNLRNMKNRIEITMKNILDTTDVEYPFEEIIDETDLSEM